MIKKYFLLPLLLLFSVLFAGCNQTDSNNAEPNPENGYETNSREDNTTIEKLIDFDLENTKRILFDALVLESPLGISEDDLRDNWEDAFMSLVIEPLRIAGVHGVVSAEWIEFERISSLPVLEITSEDNRTYWLYTYQARWARAPAIEAIAERPSGRIIFDHDPGHHVPAPPD